MFFMPFAKNFRLDEMDDANGSIAAFSGNECLQQVSATRGKT